METREKTEMGGEWRGGHATSPLLLRKKRKGKRKQEIKNVMTIKTKKSSSEWMGTNSLYIPCINQLKYYKTLEKSKIFMEKGREKEEFFTLLSSLSYST
jgi:hypothetical protein